MPRQHRAHVYAHVHACTRAHTCAGPEPELPLSRQEPIGRRYLLTELTRAERELGRGLWFGEGEGDGLVRVRVW